MEKTSDIIDSTISRDLRTSSIDRQFIESSTGGRHSFDPLEIGRFCDIINSALQTDPDLKTILPLNPISQDLFTAVENGILMCKLVNSAVPGTIDVSKINRKANMNIFQKTENVNMAIVGAKKIGCILVNMNPQLIFDKREHIILGFIWQLMRIKYISKVNVKEMPTLLALKENNEKASDFAKATPEQLLLRWFNHHLDNSDYAQRVTNFSFDLKNGLAYTHLLNQLKPETSDLSGCTIEIEQRVEKVVRDARNMGIEEPMTGNDIFSGNSKINLLFCASIFEKYPELKPAREPIKQENEDDKPMLTMDSQENIEPPQQSQDVKEKQEITQESVKMTEIFETVMPEMKEEEQKEEKIELKESKIGLKESKIELKEAQTVNLDLGESQKVPEDEEDKKKIEALLGGNSKKLINEEKEPLVKNNETLEERNRKETVKKSEKKQQEHKPKTEEKPTSQKKKNNKGPMTMEEAEQKAKEIDQKMMKVKGFCWWCIFLRAAFCLFFFMNGYNHLLHEDEYYILMEERLSSFEAFIWKLGIPLPGFLHDGMVIFVLNNVIAIESVAALAIVLYISGLVSQLLMSHLLIYAALYGGCLSMPNILMNGMELNLEVKDLLMNFLLFGGGWILWKKVCWVCHKKKEDK